jgi:alpha-ribazole phosphatase/probable phosphoglycerate mutase
MVENLFIVRHGETEGSEARRYKGTIDVPLSRRGEKQAEEAAGFIEQTLAGARLHAVYASDLQRAVRSAEIIARGHGLEPAHMAGLRERNFGQWEGLTFEEIREHFPDAFEKWAQDPLNFSPVDGETTLGLRDRVVETLESVLNAHEGGNVAVVAHGGVNRVALCHFMGTPLEHIFRVEQDFACVNIIHFADGYPVIKLLNGGAGPLSV